MALPTTPKPPPTEKKSSARRRNKFKPANRLRSWGCAPLGTDKLIEKKRIMAAALRAKADA